MYCRGMRKLLLFVALGFMYVTPSFGEEQPQTIADVRYALIGKSEEEAVKVLTKWQPYSRVLSKPKTKSGETLLCWGSYSRRSTVKIILTISNGKVSEIDLRSGFPVK
jgi:bisphosphoglycerate-dependent phosphoglycerate mutase